MADNDNLITTPTELQQKQKCFCCNGWIEVGILPSNEDLCIYSTCTNCGTTVEEVFALVFRSTVVRKGAIKNE